MGTRLAHAAVHAARRLAHAACKCRAAAAVGAAAHVRIGGGCGGCGGCDGGGGGCDGVSFGTLPLSRFVVPVIVAIIVAVSLSISFEYAALLLLLFFLGIAIVDQT